MPLRIKTIQTLDGQEFNLGTMNVLVGPNNCGKSQTLRDICDYITKKRDRYTILNTATLDFPSKSEATEGLETLRSSTQGYVSIRGVSHNLRSKSETSVGENWIHDQYINLSPEACAGLLKQLGTFWITHLDAESRLHIANSTEAYDTRAETPANAIHAFFSRKKNIQDDFRNAFNEAFEMDIALDWAAMKRWYLKVGSDFGQLPNDQEDLDKLLYDKQELAYQGDGFRSFAGVTLAILTFPKRLLLLDEPEAFLHPAQARFLGRWLAEHAYKFNAQVIVATHNADFLWGIISADRSANVIRLNRSGNETRYHVISSEATKRLAQSPLLSSQPVLDALFRKGVAVCEGDPDRAVYQTVANQQLGDIGGDEILFIHANGKDAIKTPLELLKKAFIPVCVVVDFDILNSERTLADILCLLDSQSEEEIKRLRTEIAQKVEQRNETDLLYILRSEVKEWQEMPNEDFRALKRDLQRILKRATKWNEVKEHGIKFFNEEDRGRIETLLSCCKAIGVFIVPKGELESWMPGSAKGYKWNREALDKLHRKECPDDLKMFVQEIAGFLLSSNS